MSPRRTSAFGMTKITTRAIIATHRDRADQERGPERTLVVGGREDHLARDRQVVHDADHRVDHHDRGERRPRTRRSRSRPGRSAACPRTRRSAGSPPATPCRRSSRRQRRGADRIEPGEVAEQQPRVPAGDGGRHRERAERHHAVDQDVGHRRRERVGVESRRRPTRGRTAAAGSRPARCSSTRAAARTGSAAAPRGSPGSSSAPRGARRAATQNVARPEEGHEHQLQEPGEARPPSRRPRGRRRPAPGEPS